MKTVIEMAREAGIRDCTCNGTLGCLERFASLVRADERAQRTWVGLTDEEIVAVRGLNIQGGRMRPYAFARAIETKLKEKNT